MSIPKNESVVHRRVMSSTLRCLRVLEVLAEDHSSCSFSEIAHSLGIDKSSAHRFINTLVEAGYVQRERASRRYHLTGKALWVGSGYLRNSPIFRAGHSVLESLAHASNTMAHLGAWKATRCCTCRLRVLLVRAFYSQKLDSGGQFTAPRWVKRCWLIDPLKLWRECLRLTARL